RFSGPKTSIICSPMTSLKTSIKTITYLSDIGCLEIQGASLKPINSSVFNRQPPSVINMLITEAEKLSIIDVSTESPINTSPKLRLIIPYIPS
ncbi:hypothetical protein, partial [Escherichia coli]|uniref:hypothetical protein n=1 Tax=Escherichia coli TaxID=562 RepID=UPI001BAEAFBA